MNLLIHRIGFWLAVAASLIGLYSVYLGWIDRHYHCLPHSGVVIAVYGAIEAILSIWLARRMQLHIQFMKFYSTPGYDKQDWGRDA